MGVGVRVCVWVGVMRYSQKGLRNSMSDDLMIMIVRTRHKSGVKRVRIRYKSSHKSGGIESTLLDLP